MFVGRRRVYAARHPDAAPRPPPKAYTDLDVSLESAGGCFATAAEPALSSFAREMLRATPPPNGHAAAPGGREDARAPPRKPPRRRRRRRRRDGRAFRIRKRAPKRRRSGRRRFLLRFLKVLKFLKFLGMFAAAGFASVG